MMNKNLSGGTGYCANSGPGDHFWWGTIFFVTALPVAPSLSSLVDFPCSLH